MVGKFPAVSRASCAGVGRFGHGHVVHSADELHVVEPPVAGGAGDFGSLRDDLLEENSGIGFREHVENVHVPALGRVESDAEHEPPAFRVDGLFAVYDGEALT